jgi:ATPases involved in chromosome partitioning
MQVITINNEKGGVGKTTLTGIIGAGLAMRGFKVLLMDADGQGDLTTNMGLAKQAGFFKLVKWGDKDNPDFVELRTLIYRVPQDNCDGQLYCIPGNNDSWGIPGSMTLKQIVGNLAQRFALLEKAFDYVLIDTQPSATMLHDALGLVTDWFICPTDAEPLSAYGGLRNTIAHITDIREQSMSRGRDKARLLGIIPNKFRVGTTLHRHIYQKLVEQYGDLVFKPMPLRMSIPEAQFTRTTLMQDAPELETNEFLWGIIDRIQKVTQESV